MLLKCTADGRPIKASGAPSAQGHGSRVNHSTRAQALSLRHHHNISILNCSTQAPAQTWRHNLNIPICMKMTMSTTATMTPRVHRKVMRAPHKRPLSTAGKMIHAGKLHHPHHPHHPHHSGKLTHMGKFVKMAHYSHNYSSRPPDLCDNSNDSGLGPEAVNRLSDTVDEWENSEYKRRRADSEAVVKHECDDTNDAYAFPPAPAQPPPPLAPQPPAPAPAHTHNTPVVAGCSISPAISESGKRFPEPTFRSRGKLGSSGSAGKIGTKYPGGGKLSGKLGGKLGGKLAGKYGGKLAQALARRRALAAASTSGPAGLSAPLTNRSRDGTVELQILCQPETQHRARYQTEGSRGAVKDNSGNGFPIVKLVGYDKPAVLQVFIGTDTGRVAPHMFYQACRVSGKNSTPCKERKDDGTVVIEIDLEPTKNWQVTCDCVGILKERNVDVEHRFGESLGTGGGGGGGGLGGAMVSRGKKKSTRCRMVFRTDILNSEGLTETLQVCSTQIICTQPPGVPEVSRKSLVSCPATGGLELYILGKNFLKESRVVFCQRHEGRTSWEEEVVPDKEYLQQTHLVCCVPPYQRTDISEAVCVQVFVHSGGKASEPHLFYYTPPAQDTGPQHCTRHHSQGGDDARPVMLWNAMMPPPAPPARCPSHILPDPLALKSEVADESSQHSLIDHSETSCGPDGPDNQSPSTSQNLMSEDMKVVDLRLKSESISMDSQGQMNYVGNYEGVKLSPSTPTGSEPQSPLATFTQQLQAIQNQVQTDKMVETVTAAIFNSEPAPQMYGEQPLLGGMAGLPHAPPLAPDLKPERRHLAFDALPPPPQDSFNPFTVTKMELEPNQIERRLAQQSAHMEALVEDAMKATAAMLPGDAARLDALVNARAADHLAAAAPAPGLPPGLPQGLPQSLPQGLPPGDELLLMSDLHSSVKTPPAAVKSMILSAAAEILTSDSTMNALVTSAINTANILSTESGAPAAQPPAEPAMSQAVSQAVTQAVSQAVSHAVSQAVSQEMAAPVTGLTDMSDQDLLSYINPSTFDQV